VIHDRISSRLEFVGYDRPEREESPVSFIPPPTSNTARELVDASRAESEVAAEHYQRTHGDLLTPHRRVGRLADRIRAALRRKRS
jgi:hypothetical protein